MRMQVRMHACMQAGRQNGRPKNFAHLQVVCELLDQWLQLVASRAQKLEEQRLVLGREELDEQLDLRQHAQHAAFILLLCSENPTFSSRDAKLDFACM
jgi:hypothetical protein